jgi:hypothetical protein
LLGDGAVAESFFDDLEVGAAASRREAWGVAEVVCAVYRVDAAAMLVPIRGQCCRR